MPEVRVPPLVRQVQGELGPQRLVEPSQARDRGGWRVVGRRGPGHAALEVHVADGLVGRGCGPVDGLSRLGRTQEAETHN